MVLKAPPIRLINIFFLIDQLLDYEIIMIIIISCSPNFHIYLYINLFLLFHVQHGNEGGGPCVAPVHHWFRAHV